MTYLLFDFPHHALETEYPENSARMRFGRGYEFAATPETGPVQRKFLLYFEGMRWFTTPAGTVDLQTLPRQNLGRLEEFYRLHQLWKVFWYPHPLEGNLTVRFARPLKLPRVLKGGFGVAAGFDVELIEQPL
jgi:hypothetical protein